MIPVTMNQFNFTLQQAVDFVGEKCKESIERFERDRHLLPSWNPEVDRMVEMYVDGLQNWIVGTFFPMTIIVCCRLADCSLGSLHWSFDTKRYFANGQEVKKKRFVQLLPKAKLVPALQN